MKKNLLLIGASHGIGSEIAHLSTEDHRVWQLSRSVNEGRDAANWNYWDATSESFPAGALPETLHGMVYCPGSIKLQPFSRTRLEAFRSDFELNLVGAVNAIQAALPSLKRADSASIVLFSTVAVQTGMPMHASIAAAKGAVEGLTRALAAEFAPSIRVNAIAPSLTDTPLASSLLKSEKLREAAANRHPLGRVGRAKEIASLACFLLSDDSSWMSGQVIAIDGGMGALRRFT